MAGRQRNGRPSGRMSASREDNRLASQKTPPPRPEEDTVDVSCNPKETTDVSCTSNKVIDPQRRSEESICSRGKSICRKICVRIRLFSRGSYAHIRGGSEWNFGRVGEASRHFVGKNFPRTAVERTHFRSDATLCCSERTRKMKARTISLL